MLAASREGRGFESRPRWYLTCIKFPLEDAVLQYKIGATSWSQKMREKQKNSSQTDSFVSVGLSVVVVVVEFCIQVFKVIAAEGILCQARHYFPAWLDNI